MKQLKPDNNVNSNQPNKITCTNNSPSPSPSPPNSVKISAYAWKMLAILSCIATMVMYAETMLIPGIPDLIRDFHVSYSMSSWILTSYLIAGAVMTPIAGKLSDISKRKNIDRPRCNNFYVCIWSCSRFNCGRNYSSRLRMAQYILHDNTNCNCPSF